jgi:hypothetical protein
MPQFIVSGVEEDRVIYLGRGRWFGIFENWYFERCIKVRI